MAISKLNLTRDQLALFLKDHESIRQFERLFATVDAIAPDFVNEVAVSAGNAQATANDALALIAALENSLTANGAVTDAKVTLALEELQSLKAELQLKALEPAQQYNSAIVTDYLTINEHGHGESAVGRMVWDDGNGTIDLGLKGGNVTCKIGEQEFARVYNDTASSMTKGQIVYISGAQGNRIAVKLAQADSDANSAHTIGFVAETILVGGEGWAQISGPIYKVNTLGLTAGDTVYLSPTTPGAWTTTKPVAPNHLVVVGFVERVSATVGSIFIKVDNGYELDELHNVKISAVANNDLFQYDSVGPFWKNVTPASITIGTATNIAGGSTGAIPYQSSPGATTFLSVGTADQVLSVNAGGTGPEWDSTTGTGNVVRATSPTLVTPDIGTPSSGTLTNCTGLPVATGISGLGANVATFLGTPTSANLAAAVTNETGSGALVFATSPTLVTPNLGVATATSINKVTVTAPATSATLTLANGSTLATSGAFSTTLTATAATNVTLPTTGTLATLAGTETLTNKTISGASNTLSNIANSSLTNSSVTYNGVAVALGGSGTITANTTNAATFNNSGAGAASGSTFNGSAATTISYNTIGASPLAGSTSLVTLGTVTTGTWTATPIANNYLANSSITIGTTSVSLGSTVSALSGLTSLTLTQDPTSNLQAATKQYVDAIAQGLHVHTSCMAATPASLASITGGTVTYNNGTSGVGATLTLSVALTVLDGYTLQNGDRVIVKNETTQAHNGIYTWATGGTVLTRASDFDTSIEIASGDFTFVSNGTLYANTGWVQTSQVNTVGTDSVVWQQFSGAGTYTAGTGLTLSGSQFSLTSPVVASLGGTGQTTYSVGDILYATGASALSKLTIGASNSVLTSSGTAPGWTASTGTGNIVRATSATLVTPVLGTPSSGTLSNCTGLPISTGVSGLGANIATFLGTPSSANLAAAITDETGSGALVFATSPSLVTPALGAATGTSLALTGGTLTTRAAATQDGVILSGRAGGTLSYAVTITPTTLTASRTLTLADGNTTLQAGTMAVTGTGLNQFAATTSAQLAGVISDETGSGALVFASSPTLVTPVLGAATATSINKVAITAPTTGATLTLADGSTLATAGAFSTTLTATAATNVTLPTTGTLATLAGTETLTNKTLTSPTINTATLSGGTINNAIIGGTTPVAGTFTTATATTSLATPLVTNYNNGTLAFSTTGTNPITFTAGGVERFRVGPNGNVGVGTSFPATALEVVGDITGTNLNLANVSGPTINTANSELVLQQTGDVFGTSKFRVQNRPGSNGGVVETSLGVVDFGFIPGGTGVQANFRFESRPSELINSANDRGEFQWLDGATTGSSERVIAIGRAASIFIQGNVGIGQNSPSYKLDVTGSVRATGQIISTQANNTATGSGQIYLNGATGNRIDFNTQGANTPTFTTRSVGTKIVFYPTAAPTIETDYAMGVASGILWSSIPGSTRSFNWYAGTTEVFRVKGNGEIISGNGDSAAAPVDAVYRATDGSGTDIGGADLSIKAGRGTGAGLGGDVIFFTSPAGTTGATLNASTERARIKGDGKFGIGTSAPDALLSVNGVASFGAGAVGTPSISAFGDLNTGFWFPAADTIAISTAGAERLRVDSSGNLLVTGAGGLGYGTGSGGAVTQITSRTTGVTLNKTNGAITLVSAAGTTTYTSFTVTNSTVAATDTIIVNQKSGANRYIILVTNVASGSFQITFATTGGTATEQPVFNFAVIKAAIA